MSVEVEKVSKLYGSQRALDKVSFNINAGQVVGLLGPNGAGKSTMMKIISCYIPESEGSVKVCGYSTVTQSLDVRRNVGYLPEHNPLYPDMYVREYLRFVGGIYMNAGEAAKRTEEMIEITGLTPESKKKIGALSKGYRQRVGLAQAMIHNPAVLILDEPTSGLDPNQLAEIRNLIRNIGKEKTIILSTHIMQEVEAICNRVIIINKGKIVADDDTGMLRHKVKPSHEILVEFDKQIDSAVLKALPHVTSVKHSGGNKWMVSCSGDDDIRKDIFNLAVSKNITVLSMQKEESRLEDIFQQLTQS
jgi:ABC-2 type transport system ATP-binding protein